ncbi:hypothetical protein FHS16_001959 [Paenibacillus endophyticus]|uniref:Alpha/beta hydrolase n=1 Tax=Paenibacillus endophyticus TaxID=1294268 RepID=A0A7W5GA43_9BACL|nr:hypothetical protein [Paenibacillus endophyticus]MBB3151913.1 hypothetical protein [Paenibacillus endophyticus]
MRGQSVFIVGMMLLFYATPSCTVREPQLDWCRSHLQNLTLFDIGKGFHHLLEENPHAIGRELQRWLQRVNEMMTHSL